MEKSTKHFLDVKSKKEKRDSLVENRKTIFTVIEVSDTNTQYRFGLVRHTSVTG